MNTYKVILEYQVWEEMELDAENEEEARSMAEKFRTFEEEGYKASNVKVLLVKGT